MNIRIRVARLDDAAGELTLSLRKLEMEAARGATSTDEQIDFLHDLHRAAYRMEIRPWLSRAGQAAGAGIVLLGAAFLLPSGMPYRGIAFPAAAALAGLAFLGAAIGLGVYVRNLRRERRWFKHEEAEVLAGHPLLNG